MQMKSALKPFIGNANLTIAVLFALAVIILLLMFAQ
jgi:hypothetical protein